MLVGTSPETRIDNGARSRNRTGTTHRSRDFKSLASTNFAIRADELDSKLQKVMEAEVGIEPASTALQSVSLTDNSIGYEAYHPHYHSA